MKSFREISLSKSPSGTKVVCTIERTGAIFAMVSVEDGKVYLCQNLIAGSEARELYGYDYSWCVGNGTIAELVKNSTKILKKWEPRDKGYENAEDNWKKSLVEVFVKDLNKIPLHFEILGELVFLNVDTEDACFLQITQLMSRCSSVDDRGRIIRSNIDDFSVEDVWRHMLYFYPDASIFNTMERLYEEVTVNESIGQYVSGASRRFTNSGRRRIYDVRSRDEFGLRFDDWENISSIMES